MTIKYRITDTGTEQVADNGDVTVLKIGTPEYQAFFNWLVAGGVPENMMNTETLQDVKTRLSGDIDSKIASIYSNWTRFQQEYIERLNAAQAFRDANYIGDPGVWVTSFAIPAGLTNTQATDAIINQSITLNGALQALGALRMRKYEILNAKDKPTAQSVHDDIVTKIDAVAASLS